MKLFGTDPVQRRVIRFVIQMKSSSMSEKADGNRNAPYLSWFPHHSAYSSPRPLCRACRGNFFECWRVPQAHRPAAAGKMFAVGRKGDG